MCKAACNDLADQRTKQNCLDYWKTGTFQILQPFTQNQQLTDFHLSYVFSFPRKDSRNLETSW